MANRVEGGCNLPKIGARGGREVYCVVGYGATTHFEDYEDARDEFNLRRMRQIYGE